MSCLWQHLDAREASPAMSIALCTVAIYSVWTILCMNAGSRKVISYTLTCGFSVTRSCQATSLQGIASAGGDSVYCEPRAWELPDVDIGPAGKHIRSMCHVSMLRSLGR